MPPSARPKPVTGVVRFLLPRARRHAGRLALAGLALLLSVLLHLARPWPLKLVFDYVIFPGRKTPWSLDSSSVLLLACAAALLIAVAFSSVEYTHSVLSARVAQSIIRRVREDLFLQVQRLSLGFHTRTRSGDLLSRMLRDVNQLRDFLTDSAVQFAAESVFVAGMLTVMFLLDARLAALTTALFPLMFIAMARFSGEVRQLSRRRLEKEGQVASLFGETLAAIREVHLFSAQHGGFGEFDRENRGSAKAELRTVRAKQKLLRSVELVSAAGTAGMMWYGAHRVLAGHLTPGDLVVFLTYLKSLYKPLRRMATLAIQASRAAASAERVVEILELEPEVREAPGARGAPQFIGAIEYRSVGFGYGPHPLLGDVSFRVEPGQIAAIVGPSGAGKSTLAALLPRLYDPTCGSILIDGCDNRSFTLASLRAQVAVVPQDPILLGNTIRESIVFGLPSPTEEQIRDATRLAAAEQFIDRLPRGLDTPLGERGCDLSGGERRRLAMARAFLRDAPIVILDEPLTGLDAVSERLVLDALKKLLSGKTALLITHKLSSVAIADLVIVLDRGRIVERGSPIHLLTTGGLFQRMSHLQGIGGVIQ